MCSPLHAQHYADTALQRQVTILENVPVAAETFRVRFDCPDIARRVLPGQFLMARIAGCDDPLIGRAVAVYDVVPDPAGSPCAIDLVYHVKGKFTKRLASCMAGQRLEVWGPLGNGFPPLVCESLIMVAGGVGQTPFLTLAKEHSGLQSFGTPPRRVARVPDVMLCFGASSARFLAGAGDFRELGIRVRLATDDGSCGHQGPVTDLLADQLAESPAGVQVVSCGPSAMMRRCAQIAAEFQVPCYVSLETPMACGIGICFSCVARIRDAGGRWDYQRTCVEGPVFDAAKVVW